MRAILMLTSWVLLISLQPCIASDLMVLTENLPPLNYIKDGQLVGPSVEIVREIQRRVGSNEKIEIFPWARAYKLVSSRQNVVVFGMTHTMERDRKFKWVGPLARKRDILVARRDADLTIQTLADARLVDRIGTLRGDTREELLLANGFTNLESVSDEQHNARKLTQGRINLWAYKQPGLKTVCELAGVDYEALEEVYSLREIDVSIAFSLKTEDVIVERWKDAFEQMRADGALAEIQARWSTE